MFTKSGISRWPIAVASLALVFGISLPAAAAAEVKVVEIAAVPGLQFDTPRFAVEPGQAVRLEFSNPDTMQHNLLIVKPGTREDVAQMAIELLGDGPAKEYVPDSDNVLVASRVLLHGESQTIEFTAPEESGVYPYVCTFPGHAVVMFGAMYVTTDEMPPLAEDPHVPGPVRLAAAGAGEPAPRPAHAHSEHHDEPRENLLERVSVSEGFEAVTFAQPPEVSYPTALAGTADGVLYIAVDPNGSLGKRDGMGSVVRAVDTTGDGVADTFSTFAEMLSPRALVWDGEALYVLHPPDISVFRDTTGDGVADESQVLVKDIGYGIEHPRGADHTTNGLRMGIDGWLYIAVGDFGFKRAIGADGTERELYAGGVARVRPDGSELEVVASGLRNIYDTAIAPTLDIFTRDNDNDGQDWDTRLHHIVDGAEYGYPRKFMNFTDEMLPPIIRYGQGSPTGAFFLDEPGWPERYNNKLYTAEWNHNVIDRHELSRAGAGFTEDAREGFLGIPSPTGIAADGESTLYVASWFRGGFSYSGDDVGFVVALRPEGYQPQPGRNFNELSDAELVAEMGSNSQTRRLLAQQAMLRRGDNPVFATGLQQLVNEPGAHLHIRVAALFTLKQLRGVASHEVLAGAATDDALREFALRALADRIGEVDSVPADLFVEALSDENPRVRLQAAIGIGRLDRQDLAGRLTSLLGDEDPSVAHATEKSLVRMGAVEAVFAVFDSGDERRLDGARRVLQAMHSDEVVDGLLGRLNADQPEEVRRATLTSLARLYHKEWDDWDPMTNWWGTQPDRRGPYYEPARWERTDDIERELDAVLEEADPELAQWLAPELVRHRIRPRSDQYEAIPENKLSGEIIGTEGAWEGGDATKYRAMDGDPNTFFDGPEGSGMWVGLDLGEPHRIVGVRFAPRRSVEDRMVGGRFQGAHQPDFSDAVDLYTIQEREPSAVGRKVDHEDAFRYVRYLSPDGGFGNIAIVEFYGE